MIRDRGSWLFEGVDKWDYKKGYPAIRKGLKILMENLISSKILLPKTIDFDIPLVYDTVDELLDQIEASGPLESGSEFDIWGDTVIYTSNGEKVYEDIIYNEIHLVFSSGERLKFFYDKNKGLQYINF